MRKNFDGLSGLVQSEMKRDTLLVRLPNLPFRIICKKIWETDWLRIYLQPNGCGYEINLRKSWFVLGCMNKT
jgi:hypothetical protein